jgi:hypothetical protein
MTRPTREDISRPSTDFEYNEILEDIFVNSASLEAFSMKRYQVYADRGSHAVVTAYGDFWITKYDGENYFPLHLTIDIQRDDGSSLGRIEGEYQVCFYSWPVTEPEHFEQLMSDAFLPQFWEFTGEFLCNAMDELGFDSALLKNQLPS